MTNEEYKNFSNEELCAIYQKGDNTALDVLMEKNKHYVRDIAEKLHKECESLLTIEDLYQEGNIGFIKAAKKFDIRRGNNFINFATLVVRQCIERAIKETGNMIRLPVYKSDKIIKVNKCRNKHPEASPKELVDYLKKEFKLEITSEEIDDIFNCEDTFLNVASLNEKSSDENNEKIDSITNKNDRSCEQYISDILLQEHIDRLLDDLKPREKLVIVERFGLKDGSTKTLEDVAKEFDVTRERIRQIEAKAIKKLRNPVRSKRIKDFFDED